MDRALETITRNARQQARLIEDLLDVSSILGGRLRLDVQPVDLVAGLATALESIRPAAAEKELELTTAFDPSIGLVSGDPGRLQQVFWNLLTNAVKFSPRRGRVDVRAEREGAQAVVRIADTGIGIRPEVVPVIFERFRQADSSVTRAHGGLGLGLAIARELVDLHGGTVEATSPARAGARRSACAPGRSGGRAAPRTGDAGDGARTVRRHPRPARGRRGGWAGAPRRLPRSAGRPGRRRPLGGRGTAAFDARSRTSS